MDQVPRAVFSLRAASAIQNQGELVALEVSDGMAVRVAMQIDSDPGVALEEFLQGIAADEVAPGFVIRKKGVMVEKEKGIVFGNQPNGLFEIGFLFFREKTLGRIKVRRSGRIEGEDPAFEAGIFEAMGFYAMLFQVEKLNGMGDLFT